MAKWALFAASSYVQAGAACPRTVGADGRSLRRPWRVPTRAAVQAARLHRRARPQPLWPRLVGALCLASAVWFAVHPVDLHVAAMSSAPPVGKPKPPRTEPGPGPELWPPLVLRWRTEGSHGPFTWILLDAGYEEIARRDGLLEPAFVPDAAVRELFGQADTVHWYVLASTSGQVTKSNLETLSIR